MTTVVALALLLAQGPLEPRKTFESLLQEMASGPADPCREPAGKFSELDDDLFWKADDLIAEGLNESSVGSPKARVTEALKKLEHLSGTINEDWPDENRFHFEVVEIPPALLVKMTFRSRGTFSVFAVPKGNSTPHLWQKIDALDDNRGHSSGWSVSLALFPLHRGPANSPRFLARFTGGSCAGSSGVAYYAYQWDPEESGGLASEVVKIEGSEGIGGEPLSKMGKLLTEGLVIKLPYCWFSAIDTWDNPTLCAVDSYDLSGNSVRFVGSVFNRPDLLAVARVIEYAKARDYPAVLAYCGSPEVAQRIVRDNSVFGFPFSVDVKPTGAATERVEFGAPPGIRFDVEKRGDRWLVVSFGMDQQ